MAEKHTRKIVVTDLRKIHSGTNAAGTEYTIWQVIATKETGEPIPEDTNLRTFDTLPKNQLIEVEVERYDSPSYGTSYTVSLKGKKRGAGLGQQVKALKTELQSVSKRLDAIEARLNGAAPASAAAPGPQGPPPAPQTNPPPVPGPAGDGMPGDNIPF